MGLLRWMMGRRKRFRFRPTALGMVVGLSFVLVLAAAFNTGINLLYMLAAALGSLMLVSWILPMRALRKLEVHITTPKVAYRDQEVASTLVLTNRKLLLPAGSLVVESSNAGGAALGYVQVLSPRESAKLRVREVFPSRGDWPSPEYTLTTSFPFGLIEAWSTYRGTQNILVYPRVHALRTSAAEQTSGSRYRARSASGDGDEFFSMREYLPGDDIRRISWKASARLGKLMVKELSRQNSRFVLFLLDTLRPEAPDAEYDQRFEEAVELVASLGVTLLERQYNVAVECPQSHLEGGEGSGQRRKLLEFLARVNPAPAGAYPELNEHSSKLNVAAPALLLVSPNPELWGRRPPGSYVRTLDPREVIHA